MNAGREGGNLGYSVAGKPLHNGAYAVRRVEIAPDSALPVGAPRGFAVGIYKQIAYVVEIHTLGVVGLAEKPCLNHFAHLLNSRVENVVFGIHIDFVVFLNAFAKPEELIH